MECGNCFEGKSDFDHVCPKCKGTCVVPNDLAADMTLLREAWDNGQFADDFDWPQAQPIRAAIRRICEASAIPQASSQVPQA